MDDSTVHHCASDYLTMIQSVLPDRTALIEDGHSFTYGELAREALRIRNLAAGPNQPVSDQPAPNQPAPDQLTPDQPAPNQPVSDQPTVIWIRKFSVYEQLTSFLAASGTCRIPVLVPHDIKSLPPGPTAKDIPPGACMGVLTSGTAGPPSLWFRTLESWYDFFPVQNSIFGITSQTRLFAQGSLAFTGNLNLYLAALSAGATIITSPLIHPVVWHRDMETHHANALYLIPSKLRLLVKSASYPYTGLETILAGSQSLGLKDIENLKTIYPHSRCFLYYGASELSYVTWLTDQEMNSNPACIGKPFPGVNLRLHDDGEIYVDTPYSALGITGFYSVGDTGYMDEKGYLYFNGRKDHVYNIHGRKISAIKIENALQNLNEVQEAAVILKGGTLWAYIVPAPASTAVSYAVPVSPISSASHASSPDLRRTIREKLALSLESWEIPRNILFRTHLPQNNSGKTVTKLLSAED